MATGTVGTVARSFHTQQVAYLRKSVAFDTTDIATGVSLGWLPAGARIILTHVAVTEAFNAATTNVLTVGTSGDSGLDNIVAGADVTEGSIGSANVVGPATVVLTADTEVLISYTQTGTAATAGAATVVLCYAMDNDG